MYLMPLILDHAGVTIHQGDALTILRTLPTGSMDALITDPPYSSGAATLVGKQADPASKYQKSDTKKAYPPMLGDAKDQRSFTLWSTLWMTECWRILKDGAPVLVFTDWRQLPSVTDAVQASGFLWRSIVVWHKASARPLLGEFRRDSEFVVYASKGKPKVNSRKCLPGVYSIPINPTAKVHLTGKPVALLEKLMEICPEGGIILDPFLGGGTTAIAAQKTERACIGIELSETYAALAANRIKNAYKENMFYLR
jgi:DNA modification methylase